MPNVLQKLSAQIRALKTENEELKRNTNGGRRTYIKELFKMTINHMKTKNYMNHLLKSNEELKTKIKEYEDTMKELLEYTYESVVKKPIENKPNPIKIQALVRGFLTKNKELLKCGVCYEVDCGCAKIKVNCCKQILCKNCYNRCNDTCPFCRNKEQFSNSIPFEWFNMEHKETDLRTYGIGQLALSRHSYTRDYNVSWGNVPQEWKMEVGVGDWYMKYTQIVERYMKPRHGTDAEYFKEYPYPNEISDGMYRRTEMLQYNTMVDNSTNLVIIEGNSRGIFDAFKNIFSVPSHLTKTNPREHEKIEWVSINHLDEPNRNRGEFYGIGKSSGFDFGDCYDDMRMNGYGVRHIFTQENTQGQTRDAKWNRAFMRILSGKVRNNCHFEMVAENSNGEEIDSFCLKQEDDMYLFVINSRVNETDNPRTQVAHRYNTRGLWRESNLYMNY